MIDIAGATQEPCAVACDKHATELPTRHSAKLTKGSAAVPGHAIDHLSVDSNGVDAMLPAGANDAPSNLSPVGNQHLRWWPLERLCPPCIRGGGLCKSGGAADWTCVLGHLQCIMQPCKWCIARACTWVKH